jgi:hypothetical protein
MAVSKKTVLIIAGGSAQSVGTMLKALDDDSKGLDDKVGQAMSSVGGAVVLYAAGKGGWRDGIRAAAQALNDLANDQSAT